MSRICLSAGAVAGFAAVACLMIVPQFLYAVGTHDVAGALILGLLSVIVAMAGLGAAFLALYLLPLSGRAVRS